MKRFYEDILKTSENRLKQRAYYIPQGVSEFIDLNGIWDFIYFENGDAARDFSSWGKIDVPSCWQLRGYEDPNYTNINYPYPVDIPYVPDINPMGVYRRKFNITDKNQKHYFVFEGVASCAELFINDKYVGFTTGNHLQSEFDITSFVTVGENEVLVKVHKWAVTSYIEDQDFFRFNGIFRDVYILSRPENHITDIKIITEENNILIETDRKAEVSLYYKDTFLETKTIDKLGKFTVENPKLWTAETPELYTLKFLSSGEEIVQKTGFRKIEVLNGVLYINGQNVKLKGVNHHDTTPNEGWCMTKEEILCDLLLMKDLNVNTIRTSHYPPHPEFLNMCDELGFYVMLETDIEAHGMVRANPGVNYGREWYNKEWPANLPDWENEHVQRMERAYHRDKNHPSIFAWSLGNESSFGENHIKMVEWLKNTDKTRLIHTEDACRLGLNDENYSHFINYSDLYSRMYPSVSSVKDLLENEKITAPIFLCEYSHAMGNGPGDIWDYWEEFYKNDRCAGGCIWEWADHTVIVDGVPKYGGDFNELTHDGNFCSDGLVKHDRTLKAGSLEARATYAPFRFKVKDNKLIYKNLYDFIDLEGYEIRISVVSDGEIYWKNNVKTVIKPHNEAEFDIEIPKSCTLGAVVSVSLYKGKTEIASLEEELNIPKIKAEKNQELSELFEDDLTIYAHGERFDYAFSKQTGNLISMVVDKKELLKKPLYLTAFRAPTDNDRHIKVKWCMLDIWQGENLDKSFNKCYDAYIKDNKIIVSASIAGVSRRPVVKFELVISVFTDGRINTKLSAKVNENAEYLPRLGFEYVLGKNQKFEYFGKGPEETYCDMHHFSKLKFHKSSAEKEYFPYIMPQEHGNHTSVKEIKIGKLKFSAENMDINVSKYSSHDLYKANHIDELFESNLTYLRIDYKNSGLGSNSCGPKLLEKYQLNEKEIFFEYDMELL